MYPHFDIHTWSHIAVLIYTLAHGSPFCYSNLVIYPMFMFILAHLSLCWNSQLVICPCVDIHTWSYIPMLHSSLCYVYPCSYSYLVMYPCVKMHACLCIPVLIFILIHVSTSWCSYLFMDNHAIFPLCYMSPCWYSHFVMSSCVDIQTWSYTLC